MNSYPDYQTVIGSTVNLPMRYALWQAPAEDGGIPVQLGYEPDNPTDSQAVMIVFSSSTIPTLLDVLPVTVGADDASAPTPVVYWRLGYIRRSDPGRDDLQAQLQQRDALIPGRLWLKGQYWRVRVGATTAATGDSSSQQILQVTLEETTPAENLSEAIPF